MESCHFFWYRSVVVGVNKHNWDLEIQVELLLKNGGLLSGVFALCDSPIFSVLNMQWVETPEVYKDHHICPEVTEHLCDNSQGSCKRTGESVLVFYTITKLSTSRTSSPSTFMSSSTNSVSL